MTNQINLKNLFLFCHTPLKHSTKACDDLNYNNSLLHCVNISFSRLKKII